MNILKRAGFHAEPLSRQSACDDHGEYESRCYLGDIWTGCPVCSRAEQDRLQAEADSKARSEAAERWHRRLGQAAIPERFRDRSLETYVAELPGQKRALEFARQYAARFDEACQTGRSVIFTGKTGTGKTHLAIGIALAVMSRHGATALFTTAIRAVRRIKDTWGRGSPESESDAIAALVFPDLLILDEVGVQFGTDTERAMLFDILNERYERCRPTILMSNLLVEDTEKDGVVVPGIRSYLGDRVIDRMRESGGKLVVFDWHSYRRSSGGPGGGR